jgi:hypothetical protein
VKEHSVQQAEFLPSSHRVVLLSYTQIMALIEAPVDNIMSRLQCSTFRYYFVKKLAVAKMLRQHKIVTFFQLLGVFQYSVTRCRVSRRAQQKFEIKA